jgi:hypothetical protein
MNFPARLARSSSITIAALGSVGVLLMGIGGLLVAFRVQYQHFPNVSPWHMLKFLASITTALQWVQLVGWAALTGLLIALGVSASSVPRAAAALAAGALIPVGLVLWAHQLNRLWPDTTSPTQVPAMAGLLALYVLAVPWALGRLIRRWLPAYPATQVNMTISQ